jgi:glycosyltransferase involved in cell wall biosynthesis
MKQRSVAVVIPCWNAEKFISRAIQSVFDQHLPEVEVIAIDDGSTDGTLQIIRSYAHQIRWETGRHRGAAAARNRGLSLVTSDYVLFLDADDYLDPQSLLYWVDSAENADVVFGPFAFEWDGERNSRSGEWRGRSTREEIIEDWLTMHFTATCAVLWRTSFIRSIGGWNESIKRMDDGELSLRALIDGARVANCKKGLGIYTQHDSTARVSCKVGRDIVENDLEVYRSLRERAKACGIGYIEPKFGPAYYHIAWHAFSHGWDDLGQLALCEARRLGFRGHIGSVTHQLSSTVLGLRNKIRLRAFLKRYIA